MPTNPARIFIEFNTLTTDFLTTIITNAQTVANNPEFRRDVLIGLFVQNVEDRDAARQRADSRLQQGMGGHLELFCELVGCRIIDSFTSYLTDLTVLLFQTKPRLLLSMSDDKNSLQITLKSLIEASEQGNSINDLIMQAAFRKANQLAYLSISELSNLWESKHDFALFPSAENKNLIIRSYEERNLFVHNRGVVNSIFLSKLQNFPSLPHIGERITLDRDQLLRLLVQTREIVNDIDSRAISKWSLPADA